MRLPSRMVPAVLAGAVAGAWSLAGCPGSDTSAEASDPVVARVNERVLHLSDVQRLIDRFRRQHGDLAFRSEADRIQVRDRLLEDRIQELLLLDAAEARGIEVSDEAVDRALLRMRSSYPGRTFEKHLVEEGLPMSQVRADLRERLVIRRLLADEVNARVAVSDEEIASYFDEHKEDLAHPEEVHALQIVVRTRDEAERIRKDLLRGKEFETLARQLSIAPEAARGGDLGFFARGTMPDPIDRTCFSLPVGRISEVIESPYGYHLFKVVEHRKGGEVQLDDALRETIERKLRRKKEEARQARFVEALRKKAKVTIDSKALAGVQ